MKKYFGILKKLLLLSVFTAIASFGLAQQTTITGVILDSGDKNPIPGVSVVVKGTNQGTITDFDGKFQIQASSSDILVISYMGYETQEIAVGNNVEFSISLAPAELGIDEVVVIGYGTQKKSDKTGAMSSITAEELNKGVLTDPIQGLQGKTAGVLISKKGGDPNAGFSVKIRGSSGLITGTEPLYVVDGIPGVDPTTIASEDIESFNVLKDASSTAIYGSRGANGIIMITTKKGVKDRKTQVEFNSYLSLDQVANRLKLLNADQIRKYVADNNIDFVDGGANTDWQDEIYRQGKSQSYNFAVSGGSTNTSYRLSASHNDYLGVVKGSDKKRTIARLNLTTKGLDDKLTIQSTLSGTIESNNYINYGGNGPQDVLYQAFQRNPTDPVYNEDGSFYEFQRDFQYYNPVALINDLVNGRNAKRLMGNLRADFEIIPGLTAAVNLGYTRYDNESYFFEPSYTASTFTKGYARKAYHDFNQKLLETTLTYDKSINKVHNINAILGYSYQEDTNEGFGAQGRDVQSDFVKHNNLGALNDVKWGDIWSYKNYSRLISFFGRIVYNYNSKYYFTGTIRRDGSSKFGINKEWGIFPSASAAWNIKAESFMQNVDFISSLKLRGTVGLVGKQEFASYYDQMTFSPSGRAIDPETGEFVIKFEGNRNDNPDLKWEENKEVNFGIDFGFLNNRLSGSLEYYIKTTYDLIYPYAVPVPPNKYRTTWANAGQIDNKGLEASLSIRAIDKPNLSWRSDIIFSTNEQKIVTLDNGLYDLKEEKVGWLSGRGLVGGESWTQIVKPGVALGTFYMPEYAGLSSDGKFLFYTAAGGVTREITMAERRIVGHAQPDFEIGWSNYFTIYKNFDFSFTLRSLVGFDVLNVTRLVFANPSYLPTLNALEEALVEVERGLNDIPKVNSYYLEDGTFVKLTDVTLGYTFNTSKIDWLQKLRIYFTSNNLLTLTNYTGIDPEIEYSGLSFGLDQYNVYPKTRTFTFGINLTF